MKYKVRLENEVGVSIRHWDCVPWMVKNLFMCYSNMQIGDSFTLGKDTVTLIEYDGGDQ